jgi:pimeloyl-ACP methyl ester carboxylesterase
MNENAVVADQSPASAREPYATQSVTSRDGTIIGYREFGRGPGVLIVHGSASSGHNHVQLAQALADAYTVIVPDRRGRGLSGPFGDDDSIEREVEDLDALLERTGAQYVFGVSSGGIICLQAALTFPAIQRTAIYEPPFFEDDAIPAGVLRRFDEEMAKGDVAAALVTAMRGAQMGPAIFNAMPRWLAERLTKGFMAREGREDTNGYVPMQALASTMHHDFQLVAQMNGKRRTFSAIRTPVLLLGGSKSPAYLKAALDTLAMIIQGAERVELRGVDHAASWNTDRGGRPEPVASELRRFFA